jgi:hypothetical protein
MLTLGSLAKGVKVTGSMAYSWKVASKAVRETCAFEASSLGDTWLVRVQQTNGMETLAGSDGRDFYSLVMPSQDPIAKQIRRYPGWVCRGRYPLISPGIFVKLAWLAYCSGGFLAAEGTKGVLALPGLWLWTESDPLAHIYTEKCDFLPGGSGVPSRLEFYPDASKVDEVRKGVYRTLCPVSDSERDRSVLQLAQYVGVSEPEAVYEVTGTTNLEGGVLPAEFAFHISTFYHGTNGVVKAVISTGVTGRVDSVEAIALLDPLPGSSDDIRDIQVADYRFCDKKRGVGFIPYVATNAAWRTNMSDAFLQRHFERQLKNGQRFVNQPKFPKAFVLLILTLAVLAPLLLSKRLRQGLIQPLLGRSS